MQELSDIKVSVIVTTKNSAKTLEACLESIKKQTWKNIELIVVDNYSDDLTTEIAKKYADLFLSYGPERSAQRNYGAQKSSGSLVCIIDSDMELGAKVIEESVALFNQKDKSVGGIIIPEVSFGIGFLAKVKALERSFYIGDDSIEAPRIFEKTVYEKIGGYDESMTGGEDWDLGARVRELGLEFVRVKAIIRHNEGELSLSDLYRKKKIYGKAYKEYSDKGYNRKNLNKQGAISRFFLFAKHWRNLFSHPLLYVSVFFMKAVEFLGAAVGAYTGAYTGVCTDVHGATEKTATESQKTKGLYIALNGITTEVSGGDEHAIRLCEYINTKPNQYSKIIAPKVFYKIAEDRFKKSGGSLRAKGTNKGVVLFLKYIVRTCVSFVNIRLQAHKALKKGDAVILLASSHFFFDVIPVAFAQRKAKKTVIIHHIVTLQRKSSVARIYHVLFESLSLFIIRLLDMHVVVVSPYISLKLVQDFGFNPKNIYTSSNGIDEIEQVTNRDKKFDLLYCGRLHESKGIFDFVQIVQEIRLNNPQIKAVIVGGGPEGENLRVKIKELKLEENISVLGFVSSEEKLNTMLASYILVSPTYEEGWGIVIGEALSAGLSVLAYKSKELETVWGNSLTFVDKGSIKDASVAVVNELQRLKNPNSTGNEKEELTRSIVKKYNWSAVLEKETADIFNVEGPKKPIFLLGSYGRGNMGDDIFLHAALRLFSKNRVVINTAHENLLPQDLQFKFEKITTSFFTDMWRKIFFFIKAESIIYFGGNVWVLMFDSTVKRQHLYKMIFVNFCAKLSGKKIYYIGVGAGHLDALSVLLVRISAFFADKIVFRDKDSERIVGKLGNRSQVLPDLASLVFADDNRVVERKKKVSVSFLYHVPNAEKTYLKTRDSIVETIRDLIKNGYEIVFVPMLVSTEGKNDDLWVGKDIQKELQQSLSQSEILQYSIFESRNIYDLQLLLKESKFVIAARLHACILSVLSETPVVAISYRDKVASFMKDNKLSGLVVQLDDINKLNEKVSYILDMYKEIEQTVINARKSLTEHAKQYTDIFPNKN